MRTSISIGPSIYKIKMHKWNAKVLAGSRGYHCDDNTIGLRDDMPKSMEAEVLMHELLHALYLTFNLNKIDGLGDVDTEESVVTVMSTGLCTVFVQNPWLLAYFAKAFKAA